MAPTFSFSTSAEEVAAAFTDEARGKNVLVTGTSLDGIGFETARVLAKHANLVIITGHNPSRLKLAEKAIKKDVPTANIRPLILDLSSLTTVRKAAAEVNTYPEPLHILIHNAAAPIAPFKLTVDNLENQMATDHIGPFLLTKLLAPKLIATRTAHFTPRVVFVSSIGHGLGSVDTGVNFNTLGRPDPALYQAMEMYCEAKAANVLSAVELSKRAKGHINAYSLHPGPIYTKIVQTKEAIAALHEWDVLTLDGQPLDGFKFKTVAQGAATTLVAALDPALNETPGAYLSDCVVANELIAPHSSDPANAGKLWAMTERIIGEPFVF
ncbi:NAD-P-binding protein [Mycena polygramma]|nr:NAD-P-binding protein [Mycena polygramma]